MAPQRRQQPTTPLSVARRQASVSAAQPHGAQVLRHGATCDDVAGQAWQSAQEHDIAVSSGYDDCNVIAGHGAIATEAPDALADGGRLPASRHWPLRAAGERQHIAVKPSAVSYRGETR